MRFLKAINRRVRDRLSSTRPNQCTSTGRATIGELSDKVLLNIFHYYLDVSARHWPRLVHTCRRWRSVVFAFHSALQLRLFCTHGTPVQKSLYYWPTDLLIVMEYGGSPELDPPAPEDENNIVALFEQSYRVTSISLTITSSLLEKLSAVESPLSMLENLNLLSRISELVTLPGTFQWGPRLSCLRLSRIAFPAFLPLLNTSRNLVDLQLHEVPGPWPISPDEFAHVLSRMAQLLFLSLHLLSTADSISSSPLPRERVTLSLSRLKFRGTTKFLEDMAARIDAPRLMDIEITSSDDTICDLSNLSQFIDRVELHKLHHRAQILSSEDDVSIRFLQTRRWSSTCLTLKLLCKSLPVQLSSISRILAHFPTLLFNVEDLRIIMRRKSRREDIFNGGEWLRLIASFASVKWFHASKDVLALSLHPLQSPHTRHDIVLPVLHKLYIYDLKPGLPHAPLMDEIVSLMVSRQISGHPIVVEYEKPFSFRELIRNILETRVEQVTVEMLSKDILLNIFRHYLGANPQTWHILGSVCRKWRQIVLHHLLA